MSEHSFENVPDMSNDFAELNRDTYDAPLDYDAQEWEPTEEPSEKHAEMHYTPGGNLEQEVHAEIDRAARERIVETQRDQQGTHDLPDEKELNFSEEFDEARRNSWGWDPEAQQEYEGLTEEYNAQFDNDVFDAGKRFDRGWEAEQGEFEK